MLRKLNFDHRPPRAKSPSVVDRLFTRDRRRARSSLAAGVRANVQQSNRSTSNALLTPVNGESPAGVVDHFAIGIPRFTKEAAVVLFIVGTIAVRNAL
jgi:hypothetical protein